MKTEKAQSILIPDISSTNMVVLRIILIHKKPIQMDIAKTTEIIQSTMLHLCTQMATADSKKQQDIATMVTHCCL
jgi:hypothetical protein